MIESLGSCGARHGDAVCPGEVAVSEVVGGIAHGQCGLCSTQFAAPIHAKREPVPEPDFLDEKEIPWWRQ